MSEFSQSYHLRTDRQEDAIELLSKAGKTGLVFPASKGWVTFVIAGGAFAADETVVALNSGLLLHYVYMEDHGWSVQIYDHDKPVFDYECEWDEEVVVHKNLYQLDAIRQLVLEQGHAVDGLEEIFEAEDEKFAFEEPAAYQFAELAGLPRYQWLSADYYTEDDPVFSGVTLVTGPEALNE